MAKFKKWIQAKKAKTSRIKNISSQLELFFTSKAKKAFIKLRQAFIKAPILNHFDSKRFIKIVTNTFNYAISEIFS